MPVLPIVFIALAVMVGIVAVVAIVFSADKHPRVNLPREGDVVRRDAVLDDIRPVRVHHAGWR